MNMVTRHNIKNILVFKSQKDQNQDFFSSFFDFFSSLMTKSYDFEYIHKTWRTDNSSIFKANTKLKSSMQIFQSKGKSPVTWSIILLGAGPIPSTVSVPAGISVCPASATIYDTISRRLAFLLMG
ncbi:hypothetical protein MBGDC06_00150 [Thermoplasmatales archaeon SCGC AB-539-C06]|nr:hypothetical protein MBGDC06_00150 [Thermoplasmatales archaeon SCGC AB-539-C06]